MPGMIMVLPALAAMLALVPAAARAHARHPGLLDETMLHPMDGFTGYTLKQGNSYSGAAGTDRLSGEHRTHAEASMECFECHGAVVNQALGFIDPELHINGAFDVQIPSGASSTPPARAAATWPVTRTRTGSCTQEGCLWPGSRNGPGSGPAGTAGWPDGVAVGRKGTAVG